MSQVDPILTDRRTSNGARGKVVKPGEESATPRQVGTEKHVTAQRAETGPGLGNSLPQFQEMLVANTMK